MVLHIVLHQSGLAPSLRPSTRSGCSTHERGFVSITENASVSRKHGGAKRRVPRRGIWLRLFGAIRCVCPVSPSGGDALVGKSSPFDLFEIRIEEWLTIILRLSLNRDCHAIEDGAQLGIGDVFGNHLARSTPHPPMVNLFDALDLGLRHVVRQRHGAEPTRKESDQPVRAASQASPSLRALIARARRSRARRRPRPLSIPTSGTPCRRKSARAWSAP
jgi:hypothetical protein